MKDTEHFGETFKKGEDDNLGDDLEKFFAKLLPFFERMIFNRTSKRVNFLLTRVNDQKLEIVADGNSDKDEDGNWRLFIDSSGDLIIQKRVSGTWTNYLLQGGSAQGQMAFWDATLEMWVHTEVSEMFWDDVEKFLGINNSNPLTRLDVGGTVRVTRILAGGVH